MPISMPMPMPMSINGSRWLSIMAFCRHTLAAVVNHFTHSMDRGNRDLDPTVDGVVVGLARPCLPYAGITDFLDPARLSSGQDGI